MKCTGLFCTHKILATLWRRIDSRGMTTSLLGSLASQTLSGPGRRESGLIPIHYWCNLWGFKAGLPKWCYVNAATCTAYALRERWYPYLEAVWVRSQPMTHTLRHEFAIRFYMGLLGVNIAYIAYCFVRTLAIVGKGLSQLTRH